MIKPNITLSCLNSKKLRLILLFATTLPLTQNCTNRYQHHFQKGMEFKAKGNSEKAFESFNRALKIEETAEVLKEIGNYYLESKQDLGKAEEFYQRSHKIDPEYPNAIHNIGLVYLKKYEDTVDQNTRKGDQKLLQESEKWFAQNNQDHPDFALTYVELAKIEYYKGSNQKAIEILEMAISRGVNPAIAARVKGEIYFEGIKDWELALDQFRIAYDFYSNDPNMLYMMGICYKKTGNENESIAYLNRYIDQLQRNGVSNDELEALKEKLFTH